MQDTRVAITGIGVVSPAGVGKEAYWSAITGSSSLVRSMSRATVLNGPSQPYGLLSSEVPKIDIREYTKSKICSYMDRSGVYAVVAAMDCLNDAQFGPAHPDYEQLDVYVGSCCGAEEWIEREFKKAWDSSISNLHPLTSVLAHPGNVIGLITIVLKTRGRGVLFSNLESSGIDALRTGFQLILSGKSRRVLIGATEAPLTSGILSLFRRGGFLAHSQAEPGRALRPFDSGATGIVLGEGAAMLLLEEWHAAVERGARIYGEVVASACCSGRLPNANQQSEMPGPTECAIFRALSQARMGPSTVDFVSLDGTGLPRADQQEAVAMKSCFRRDAQGVPVSSIKSKLAYALSVSGIYQAAMCALIFERGVLPHVINCDHPQDGCDLNFIRNKPMTASPSTIVQSTTSLLEARSAAIVFRSANGRSL